MSYLKSKDGSIEASIKEMQKNLKDNAYQQMFKKELEKTGKGIASMSDQEKKDFFNKIDKKYKAKSEVKESDAYDNDRYKMKKYGGQILARIDNSNTKDGKDHVYAPNAKIAKQLYSQGKKVYREEKESVEESFDIEKLKEDVNTLWSNAAKDLEEMKKNAKYMKAQDVAPDNDTDSEKDDKKGKTLVGSKQTKVETEPKVDYVK